MLTLHPIWTRPVPKGPPAFVGSPKLMAAVADKTGCVWDTRIPRRHQLLRQRIDNDCSSRHPPPKNTAMNEWWKKSKRWSCSMHGSRIYSALDIISEGSGSFVDNRKFTIYIK